MSDQGRPTPGQADPLPARSRQTRLSRQSVAGPEPTGRYAAREVSPMGEGGRTLPEKMAGWSFHLSEGFKMADFPLGNPAPTSLTAGLAASGYETEPSRVIGDPASNHRLEVYDKHETVEFLIVIHSDGIEQLVIAKGFPALMELLQKWHPIVTACGKAADVRDSMREHARAAEEYNQGRADVNTLRATSGMGPIASPIAAGQSAKGPPRLVMVTVGDEVAARDIELSRALTLVPKATPAEIRYVDRAYDDRPPVRVWNAEGGGWEMPAAPEPPEFPPNVMVTKGGKTEAVDNRRFTVRAIDGRLLAKDIPLSQVVKMAPMPHDCHGATAVVSTTGKIVKVYSGPERKWMDPPETTRPPKPLT